MSVYRTIGPLVYFVIMFLSFSQMSLHLCCKVLTEQPNKCFAPLQNLTEGKVVHVKLV